MRGGFYPPTPASLSSARVRVHSCTEQRADLFPVLGRDRVGDSGDVAPVIVQLVERVFELGDQLVLLWILEGIPECLLVAAVGPSLIAFTLPRQRELVVFDDQLDALDIGLGLHGSLL